MNENFRLTNNLDELADVVKNIIKDDIEFIIWQNFESEKNIIPGVLKGHIQKKDMLCIDFEIYDSSKITEKEKIFLFCKKMNILIKGKIKHITKTSLQIKIDKKFYLNEQRREFRMDVTDKNIMISVMRTISQQEREKEEIVQLKDLSNNGCALIINASRTTKFQPGSKITIINFGTVQLEEPIQGMVAHISPIKAEVDGLNDQLFLIGIKFDHTVPNIDHYLQRIEFDMN